MKRINSLLIRSIKDKNQKSDLGITLVKQLLLNRMSRLFFIIILLSGCGRITPISGSF